MLNNFLSTSTSTTQLTCQKYFDEPTSHAVKHNLQLVIKTAHSKIKKTTCVWHTRKVARIECPAHRHDTDKLKEIAYKRRSLIGRHTVRKCMHSCKHGNRTQTTLFLRGQNRFASQFSANHIQFRIAKLRFCIANCNAIPDKFIPAVHGVLVIYGRRLPTTSW